MVDTLDRDDDRPSGVLRRTLRILECLSENAGGMQFHEIAEQIGIPRSAVHRLLSDLCDEGYVLQDPARGDYVMTAKVTTLAYSYLSTRGVTDLVQPILTQLAEECGELVRFAIVDGNRLTFVARAQGVKHGLRYDPDMGRECRLSCSASGFAWLATKSDEEALNIIHEQGFFPASEQGPNAPETDEAFLAHLKRARALGYALTSQTFSSWMNAVAAPVRSDATGETVATVVIAGPLMRLTERRMEEIAPQLTEAASRLGEAYAVSAMIPGREGTGRSSIFT